MPLAEDDDVVQAFSADGSDQPFAIGILPRRGGGNEYFFDAHRIDALAAFGREATVTVVEQVPGCRVVGKGLGYLLGGPPG